MQNPIQQVLSAWWPGGLGREGEEGGGGEGREGEEGREGRESQTEPCTDDLHSPHNCHPIGQLNRIE